MASTGDLWAQALQDYRRGGGSPASALVNFDPMAALRTYGQAAAGDFQKTLKRNLTDLRGAAVGAGRLNTGFYDQDTGRLVTDISDQYERDLARESLSATGMKLGAMTTAAGMESDEQNRYLEMLTGQLDREQAAQNARRQQQSGLLGTLGSVAGTVGGALLLSDRRYKDDVEPLEGASDRLRRMPAYRFRYRGDDEPQVGVMAQDVEREEPEAVEHMGGSQGPMMVDYLKLIPMTIEAVREQGDEIRKLRGELHGGRERMVA